MKKEERREGWREKEERGKNHGARGLLCTYITLLHKIQKIRKKFPKKNMKTYFGI